MGKKRVRELVGELVLKYVQDNPNGWSSLDSFERMVFAFEEGFKLGQEQAWKEASGDYSSSPNFD